ncbi:uncharacterized protein [Musca autumnalis]|uniref:uncharacterized protein n=1 Tax=Musca autumnalis TaxID=221902 RepID=UPI003CEBE3E8
MTSETAQEERLTKSDFIHLIPHLPLKELLLTEFYTKNQWCKLFKRKPNGGPIIICNLCQVEASSFKNLLAHIDGRRHMFNIDDIVEIFHPEYTQPKSVLVKSDVVVKKDNKGNNGNLPDKRKLVLNPVARAAAAKESLVVNPVAKAVAGKECIVPNPVAKIAAAATEGKEKQVINPAAKIADEAKSKEETKGETKSSTTSPSAKTEKIQIIKEEKEEEQKPQYTTNKIIIPTKLKNKNGPSTSTASGGSSSTTSAKPIPVRSGSAVSDKNKKHPPKNSSQKPVINTPSFSTKEFSLKPDSSNVCGLLGVEYVIKILKSSKDTSPRYECGLCELVLDGFAMQRHLEGYNHRLKFCEKHFPTAVRHYRQYMHGLTVTEELKVMTKVLAKLAIAIEKYHGRNLPYECYERDFTMNRHSILAKAFSCRHASEQYGPTFTHVIEAPEINQFKNEVQVSNAPALGQDGPIFDSQTGPYGAAITSSFPNRSNFGNGPMYNAPNPILPPRPPNSLNVCDQYSTISSGGNMMYSGGNPAGLPDVSGNFMDLNSGNCNQYNNPMQPGGVRSFGNISNFGNYQEFPTPVPPPGPVFPPGRDFPNTNSFEEFNPVMPRDGFRRQPVNDVPPFPGPSRPPMGSPTNRYNDTANMMDTRDNSAGHHQNYESMVEDFLNACKERDRQKRANHMTEEDRFIENVEMYHKIVDKRIADLKRKFEKYRKDPESYPDYSEEWQKFWKRRKEELKSLGLDYRSYNFQPEWIKFVKIRLEEIYNLEVENIKQKTRDALGLNLSSTSKPSPKAPDVSNQWGGNPAKRHHSPSSFDDDEDLLMTEKKRKFPLPPGNNFGFNSGTNYGGNRSSSHFSSSSSSVSTNTAPKQKSLSETLAELIKPKSKF